MTHEISLTTAGELDMEWYDRGMQSNIGLRIVSHYASGNRTVTFLEVPGDDNAPLYRRVNNHFEHVSGPTLDEWLMQAEYRDEAETTAGLLSF